MTVLQHPLVIRRAEREAFQDAHVILAQARREAATERDAAARQGFADGLAAGRRAAAAMMEDLSTAIGAYWSAREDELVSVGVAIAHRVIGQLPSEEALKSLAMTALAEHRVDTRMVLRANPSMAAMLQTALTGEPRASNVEVQADPALEDGRIMLAHPQGNTEIGLLDQFRALLRHAEGGLR